MTDNLKTFLTFSRSERIAIIAIVLMIIIILIIKHLLITNPPKRTYYLHDLDSIIARREMMFDSIRIADSIKKSKACLATTGYQITPTEKHRTSTENVNKSKTTRKDKACLVPTNEVCEVLDLNVADTTLLKQLPGIGSSFAKRIVTYRDKLGGYCETEQLLEVYGMDGTRFEGFKNQLKIDSSFTPNKLRINQDAFKVLLKHPYLEFDDVKKIVNHREQKGMIASWEQLRKVVGDAINPKLQYYIDYQ